MVATSAPDEDDAIEQGRRLFEAPWGFLKGVVDLAHLPAADRPEVAFAGRSNVGKSSLINALVRQGDLARTSNTPGRTQEINYFLCRVASPSFYLVDMPGYGFAKAPKPKVEAWTALVKDYLRGRATLARVYVLIDSRHGIKDVDRMILAMLDEAAVSYQVVLTKADKISTSALAQCRSATAKALEQHPAAFPEVLVTSSETGDGIDVLRAAIWRLVAERSAI